MKWLRISALISAPLGLLALAVFWSLQKVGFATPAAYLDAYREATRAGDVEEYLKCLADPLRAEIQRQHTDGKKLAESLRQETKDVKTWVQLPDAASDGRTAPIRGEAQGDSRSIWTHSATASREGRDSSRGLVQD